MPRPRRQTKITKFCCLTFTLSTEPQKWAFRGVSLKTTVINKGYCSLPFRSPLPSSYLKKSINYEDDGTFQRAQALALRRCHVKAQGKGQGERGHLTFCDFKTLQIPYPRNKTFWRNYKLSAKFYQRFVTVGKVKIFWSVDFCVCENEEVNGDIHLLSFWVYMDGRVVMQVLPITTDSHSSLG